MAASRGSARAVALLLAHRSSGAETPGFSRGEEVKHLAVFLPNKEHLDEYLNRYPAPGPQLSAAATATGGAVPVGDAGQREHGLDRAGGLVGPGADRVGDGGGNGDTLF